MNDKTNGNSADKTTLNISITVEDKKFLKIYAAQNSTTISNLIERTIEYVAPFDRYDREQDYETAWRFFEEKYGKGAQ